MRSHAQRKAAAFAIVPTETGYAGEIPYGNATTRYAVAIRDGEGAEAGDYVTAGQTPRGFFEMRVARVGNTGWPSGGAVQGIDFGSAFAQVSPPMCPVAPYGGRSRTPSGSKTCLQLPSRPKKAP